ncbi:MAG: DUF1456 family protein [Spirochaetales bacterium]
MTNNDILRRIRFALNIPDVRVLPLMAAGGQTVTQAELEPWFLKDEDPGFVACPGLALNAFLDGLILEYRGLREGSAPAPVTRINNNLVLKKLRIALSLQEEDCLAVLAKAGMPVSKNELSALFRKPGTTNFKVCGDQLLRNFLTGLIGRPRPS